MFRITGGVMTRVLGLMLALAASVGASADQRLQPSPEDGLSQFFGESMAFDDDGNLAVGAKWDLADGYVDIFKRQAAQWQPVERVRSSYPGLSSFGYKVATGGGWLAVANRDVDLPNWPSYVNLYRRQGGAWTFVQRVTPPDLTGNNYVHAMAVSGSALAMRMNAWSSEADIIAMRTAVFDFVDGTWVFGTDLERAPAETYIGSELVFSGDALVASGFSSVSTFVRGSGGWMRTATMKEPSTSWRYGAALAACGDHLVAADQPLGAFDFKVYVYRRSGNGWIADGAPLAAPAGSPPGGFGSGVACDGDGVAVLSAYGRTIHVLSLAGDRAMRAVQVADPQSIGSLSGVIAMHGSTVAVSGNSGPHQNLGAVYVFDNALDPVFSNGFE